MIYILLINGASIVPFFLPGLPQLLLILGAVRVLLKHGMLVSLPIFAVLISLGILLLFSVFEGLPEQGLRVAKLIVNSLVAYIFAVGMVHRYGERFPHFYSRALLFFTVIGIFGSFLTLISDWNIAFALGEREYHTNLLTAWLTDAGFNSSHTFLIPFPYRLQSLFDEPGTFGILLIPALFYYVSRGDIKESFILIVGVLLSESANAWVLCFIILIGKAWMLNSKLTKSLLSLALATLLAIAAPILVQLYEIKAGIDEAYSNSSSLGTRSQEYAYLLDNWDRHLFPFQNLHAFTQFPDGISVSYVSWYIHGGVVFASMLLIIVFNVAMVLFRGRRGDPARHFQIVLGLILLLSGAQRSSLFDNVLFMTLAFWVLLHKPIRSREVHAAATGCQCNYPLFQCTCDFEALHRICSPTDLLSA